MDKVKIAYFGTPDFAAEFLKKMLDDPELPIDVKYIFTQPDSKVGRKQTLTKTPVKELAEQYALPVHTNLNEASQLLKEVDLAILFAFGELITKDMLAAPKFGFWNIHPSLLPRYRGPAPIATPLLNGDNETGITLMLMDEELDHGPIIAQEKVYIFPVWRRDQLEKHLIDLGYELFKKVLLNYASDLSSVPSIPQNHAEATFTERMKKDDGFIPANEFQTNNIEKKKEIFNKFRGYYSWPGVWTKVTVGGSERRLKITKIHWENDDLIIKRVQLEGKNEVDYDQYVSAYGPIKS